MRLLVKLVCASCGTTVGKISRNEVGVLVRERVERNRYFFTGGSAPEGFASGGAVAARQVDRTEKEITDPRSVLLDFEQACEAKLGTHPFLAYGAICWKCNTAISVPIAGIISALDAAEEKDKVRRAVLHPPPPPRQ